MYAEPLSTGNKLIRMTEQNVRRQTSLLHFFVMILSAMSMEGQSYNSYYVTLKE